MEKKEIYKITNGSIEAKNIKIPFFFGIVYSTDGLISLDIFVNDESTLKEMTREQKRELLELECEINCTTEENNILKFDNLQFSEISSRFSRIKMFCYGKMEHNRVEKDFYEEISNDSIIKYLVVEGLKINFRDFTEKRSFRRGQTVEDLGNFEKDHTSAVIFYKNLFYSQIYHKSQNEDIVIEFTESNNQMSYEEFSKIKNDYISVLSLINGAEVRIRKECFGSYFYPNKIDAEKVTIYSFEKINNKRHNNYIPINDSFYSGENILSQIFKSFDKFIEWNNKIDLKSIIFYLSNSEQAISRQEKVFIQIIAFERLSTLYAESFGEKEVFLPIKEDFTPIKNKLLEILELNKEVFGNAYNTVKGKISNLNQIKRVSTTDKMYRLISDFNIPIDSKIENLIDIVRHETVHKGNIGEGEKAWTTFYLLDELIREIILRMIEYNGQRKSRILLK